MKRGWADNVLDTTADRAAVERERFILEITETLAKLMDETSTNRSELADRMGVSPAFITKALRGTNNFTAATLASLFTALGKSVHVSYAPIGDEIRIPECDLTETSSYLSKNLGDFKHLLRKDSTARCLSSVPKSSDLDFDGNFDFPVAA